MSDKKMSQISVISSPSTGAKLPLLNPDGTNSMTTLQAVQRLFTSDPTLNKNISGSFIVSGSQSITGVLLVSGHTFLGGEATDVVRIVGQYKQSGDMYVSGNSIVTGNFSASGNVTIGTNSNSRHIATGLIVLPNTIVNGVFVIGTGVTINGPVRILGSVDMGVNGTDSTHVIRGNTSYTDIGTFDKSCRFLGENVDIKGWHSVGGSGTISGYFNALGDVDIGTNSSNLTTVKSRFLCLSDAYFTQQLLVNGNTTITGNILVKGTPTFGDSTSDSASFVGKIAANGVTVSNGLNTQGTFRSSGLMLVEHSGFFAGPVWMGSSVIASGGTTFGSLPTDQHLYKGDLVVSRHQTVTGNQTVLGNFNVSGTVTEGLTKIVKFSGVDSTVTLTASSTTATATLTNHSLNAGDIVYISGTSSNLAYYGSFAVSNVINSNQFSYVMASTPPSPAGGTSYLGTVIRQGNARGVTRVARLSEGLYEILFDNSFPDAKWTASIVASQTTTPNALFVNLENGTQGVRTNSIRIVTQNYQGGASDAQFVIAKFEPF